MTPQELRNLLGIAEIKKQEGRDRIAQHEKELEEYQKKFKTKIPEQLDLFESQKSDKSDQPK